MQTTYKDRLKKLQKQIEDKQPKVHFITMLNNGTYKDDYTDIIYNSMDELTNKVHGTLIIDDLSKPTERGEKDWQENESVTKE